MSKSKKVLALILIASVFLIGCESKESSNAGTIDLNALTLEEIQAKAIEEGEVNSVGMPDTWANWVGTWTDINQKYNITHTDSDMSSAEEIALFEAEKSNPTKDIGDVGQSFGPLAEKKELTLPYKTSYWDEIPKWAKDDNGDWIVGYTGTISFITNLNTVNNPPKSFADILKGDYKVTLGDVNAATQAQNSVLSAAIANGGDETNIDPGIEFFAKLASQGRLDMGDADVARLEAGEIEVGIYWDFNALNYVDSIKKANPNAKFEVTIPQDGTVQSGYATIINAYAPHPHAAALTREYILSDKGQINLAKGYARPIRESVKLPEDVKAKLIDPDQYKAAKPIEDKEAWDQSSINLGQRWQEEVLTKIK